MNRRTIIYAKLGRAWHRISRPFLRLYMNEHHVRVRVLLVNEKNEVLLVRNWLGRQWWSLPGGGIKRHEAPVAAAIRELKEETGIQLQESDLSELGRFISDNGAYKYMVACFVATVARHTPRIRGHQQLELLDEQWFAIDNLPDDLSPSVVGALKLHRM